MEIVMNKIGTTLGAMLLFIGLAAFAVLIFTTPAWYIWNHIVAGKFDLPMFTFWEAFWTLLMIRFICPNISTTEKK